MNGKDKKLTVNVITYNHEKYIEQCLNSILSQKTNFDFVVRIFDDASTDKTQEICKKYKEKYGNQIQLFFADKNLGIENKTLVNALRSYENIETPYYIFIEGDDYCIGNKRFQKQVDILDKHLDCVCCCGRIELYSEKYQKSIGIFPLVKKEIYTIDDAKNSREYFHVQHSGKMVRTSAINIDKDNPTYFIFDITQMYELLKSGNIYMMKDTVSAYRLVYDNPGSIYASKGFCYQAKFLFDTLIDYDNYTNNIFSINLMNNMISELRGKYEHYFFIKYKEPKSITYNNLNEIKHYFIPRFILDILNLPRDLSRLIRKSAKEKR